MAFYRLEKLVNLGDGYRKVFRIAQHEILLVHEAGQSYLFENFCPHRGQALTKSTIGAGKIVCPRHGFQFDLSSGQCVKGQCSALTTYAAEYDRDYLGISV
ncbi:MAG TPA: Rieske (2Fe-2S) protein [Pseudomonadales bacterium]